jgi:hypothetical protein
LKPGLLDGVHLPELMSSGGLARECRGTLPTTWAIEANPLEGALEHSHRRNSCRFVVLQQLHANPTGSPLGVVTPEPAGAADHGLRIGGG